MSDIISAAQNPLQAFTQGYGFGSNILQQQLAAEQAELQNNLLIQQQAEQQQKTQTINDLYGRIMGGGGTAQDYADLIAILPEDQSEQVQNSFNMMNEAEQRNALNQTGQVFSAFKSGRPDIAISLIDDLATAYQNEGDEQAANLMRTWANVAKEGEQGQRSAEAYFGYIMANISGGTDYIDSAIKLQNQKMAQGKHEPELRQMAADLKLTNAQTDKVIADTADLTAQTARDVMELESLKDTKGLTAKEASDKENTLRKEFNSLMGDYDEITVTYDNIVASGGDTSGAGDVALVTAFMKMLDPGSVVRETEFATAQNTAGLFGRLQTILPKLEKGEFLTADQRKNFTGLAKKYFNSYKKKADKYVDQYTGIAEDYNLNVDNIIRGTEEPMTGEEMLVQTQQNIPAQYSGYIPNNIIDVDY